MLSSVLRSKLAIEINISIIRAFIAVRQLILAPNGVEKLSERMDKLEDCIEDILRDQNDINEDTCMKLELIN